MRIQANLTRRDFVQRATIASLGLLAARSSRAAESEARIEILPDEKIGKISPDIYGHFAEHIGGVIYDGIWVGEKSKIRNYGGVRAALVDYMKRIKPPVVRWPGGCFADSYNWRDGIGPRNKRPSRPNFWINESFLKNAPDGPAKYDPNEFGTNEFTHFCKLIGAQPYLAVNLRSNSARDFYEWVDYCNSPVHKTTLANQRAENGDRDPFQVRFWGVGNESWGCGGNFTPEEYATEFRRFTAWVPGYGIPLSLIGSGPNGGDLEWTKRFFAKLTERDRNQLHNLFGWALHYYCGTTGKGQALDFTTDDWYALLGRALVMEKLITDHWAAMGEVDRDHRVKLVVDEWGAWHRAGSEVARTHLFGQTSTMRDALVAGLTLDIFNRHADKIAMANVAQLVNNLHSLFLAHEDKFVATPNFHVFEMYAAHQGGQSLRTNFDVPGIDLPGNRGDALPGVAGSASLHNKKVVLTVVNPHTTDAKPAEIKIRGAEIKSAKGQVLASNDMHAHNSFANPNAVTPRVVEVSSAAKSLHHSFAPASVTRLELEIG